MNLDEMVRTSLSGLARDIEPTVPDPAAVRARVNRANRIHTIAATALAAAAVVVVILVGSALTQEGQRADEPIVRPTPTVTEVPKAPSIRELTYATGTTIHWGDQTIDIRAQAISSLQQLRMIDYVDATDDGAVFVTGQHALPEKGWRGPAGVWFTDGSTPVRIGTTSGTRVRGFGIAPTAEGSTLAWIDPGTKSQPGAVVVFDTAQMKELARLGDVNAVPLAVYDDVVYWSSGDCSRYLWGAAYGCEPTARVMRFETASGRQSPVSMADYETDRQTRPGLLTGPSPDRQIRRGVMYLHFVRHGNRLVADGVWEGGGVEFTPIVALTGQPLRLRLPAGDKNPDEFHLTQWLDSDHVVLDPHDAGGTDLLVCGLSTGACRLTAHVPVVIGACGFAYCFTPPGPVVSHG